MKALKLFLIASSCILFYSCDLGPITPEADLEVRVQGYLSGKAREGIRVQLYRTREDAQDRFDPVTGPLWTDRYGYVEIYGLLTNRRYFVRADARAATTIRRSPKMSFGPNHCVIRIL